MSPIMRKEQENGYENRAPELHSQERANAADGAGRETREKIRAAPGHCGSDAEDNSAGHLLRLVLFYFEAEFGHDFLQVLPDVTLGGGIAQQIGRMIGGDHFIAAILEPFAAKMRDAAIGSQQSLRGGGAKADDDFRPQGIELTKKKWGAGIDIVVFRLEIAGRPDTL